MLKALREEGDKPILTDAMFNFVAGSCFEIGVSLAILDNPGNAGLMIDDYARRVDKIIDKVYYSPLGEQEVTLASTARPVKIRDLFTTKILQELSPASDQMGRCLDKSKIPRWFDGEGLLWLHAQLQVSSALTEHNYCNMLTKIKTFLAFGSTLLALINHNDTIARLTAKDELLINERYRQYLTRITHDQFDDPVNRARTEKMPIIDGKPLHSAEHEIDVKLISASIKCADFGKIYHVDAMTTKTTDLSGKETIAKYLALEETKGRQGMPRLGQDVKNIARPGLLGESSLDMMPRAFQTTNLHAQLNSHSFEHGSGLNRWQLHGRYALESWDHSLPAAGAHSKATANAFLAANCLDDCSIFGNDDAKTIGLMVSSFLNAGGYHSFVETYPIAQAVALNERFVVKVSSKQKKLYADILNDIKVKAVGAYEAAEQYFNAYQQSTENVAQKKSSIAETNDAIDALDLAPLTKGRPGL